jgi:hypothetical protein
MSAPATPPKPQLVSLRTIAVEDGGTFDWHAHPFEEFTLVTDDACLIGYPPGWRETAAGTLLHYHRGERHGAWVSPRQHPRFWVVHFTADAELWPALSRLSRPEPEQRVWRLSTEQCETFQGLFLQLLGEHSSDRPQREAAASAWLQLLLVTTERWAGPAGATVPSAPPRASPEVLRLWHLVNAAVSKPGDELSSLYSAPNYDSARHAFRKTFGCSPREMLQRLRLAHAKNLLLESSLSIKEIAARVGYLQQHDFNRLFRRHTGIAPSRWRDNPLARAAGRT